MSSLSLLDSTVLQYRKNGERDVGEWETSERERDAETDECQSISWVLLDSERSPIRPIRAVVGVLQEGGCATRWRPPSASAEHCVFVGQVWHKTAFNKTLLTSIYTIKIEQTKKFTVVSEESSTLTGTVASFD